MREMSVKALSRMACIIEKDAKKHRESLSKKCIVSVLCFHDVSDTVDSAFTICKAEFEKIIESITEKCICADDGFYKRKSGVVLSFDDGYESVYSEVFPLLKKKGIPFITYISTDFIGKSGYMTQQQIAELALHTDICSIGSHMCSHRKTREMTDKEIHMEWSESKRILEKITGVEVRHAALPYGSVASCSRKSIRRGFDAGFKTVATTLAIPYMRGKIIPRFVYQNNKEFCPILPEMDA